MVQAIYEVNLPKFLSHDLPLFHGIVSDLFPGTVNPTVPEGAAGNSSMDIHRKQLVDAIHTASTALNLLPSPAFVEKVVQVRDLCTKCRSLVGQLRTGCWRGKESWRMLFPHAACGTARVFVGLRFTKCVPHPTQVYEMMCVRHGFMVVGQPFSGKSSALRVLGLALTECASLGVLPCALHDKHELPVTIHTMNPKALSIDQLYGKFDPVSKEWSSGVLARVFRACANARARPVADGSSDADTAEEPALPSAVCVASSEVHRDCDLPCMCLHALFVRCCTFLCLCAPCRPQPGCLISTTLHMPRHTWYAVGPTRGLETPPQVVVAWMTSWTLMSSSTGGLCSMALWTPCGLRT
jgi:hypothetical protein